MKGLINFGLMLYCVCTNTSIVYAQQLHHTLFVKEEPLQVQAGIFEVVVTNKAKALDTTKWLKVTVSNIMEDACLVVMRNDSIGHSRSSYDLGFDMNFGEEELHNYRDTGAYYIVKKLNYKEQHTFFINLNQELQRDLLSKKRYDNNHYCYTFLYKIYNINFMKYTKDSIINGRDWFGRAPIPHIQICNFDANTEDFISLNDNHRLKVNSALEKPSFWQKIKSFFTFLFE